VALSPSGRSPRRAADGAGTRASAPRPQIRILFRKAIAMGPGKADLLMAIERTGSISAAAREMDMSYRRAWLLVDVMNRSFVQPLVTTETGGQKGGGARVTDFGRDVLGRYLQMEAQAAAAVARSMTEFVRLMAPVPADEPRPKDVVADDDA
jgi:molybdate transport system regulatory protein